MWSGHCCEEDKTKRRFAYLLSMSITPSASFGVVAFSFVLIL
jgi:hypothetical protein